jgi:hypothetical protein
MIVDILLVLLLLVHDMLLMMLLLVLLIRPWEMFASLPVIPLILVLELSFWGELPRMFQDCIWTNICIILIHMIIWVLRLDMWPSLGFPNICLLTLRDPRLVFLCPLVCRYEDVGCRTCAWWHLILSRWSRPDGSLHPLWWPPRGMCFIVVPTYTLWAIIYTHTMYIHMISYLWYEIVVHVLIYLYHAFISSLACSILCIMCHAWFVCIFVLPCA